VSFAKRFIGAENLPTRLSEFDVQQLFCLSADDIAARGLAMLLGIKSSTEQQAGTGKSSVPVERMPLVLADLWAHAKRIAQTSLGASNPQALA
jgi:hypothetical protein